MIIDTGNIWFFDTLSEAMNGLESCLPSIITLMSKSHWPQYIISSYGLNTKEQLEAFNSLKSHIEAYCMENDIEFSAPEQFLLSNQQVSA